MAMEDHEWKMYDVLERLELHLAEPQLGKGLQEVNDPGLVRREHGGHPPNLGQVNLFFIIIKP